jgi:hypothetical protein
MSLDGLRAWIGEVERKLGMRTRVFLVLAVIAIGGAGAAIYLAIDTRENAVSESDVQALQEKLEARIAAGAAAAPAEPEGEGGPVPGTEPAPGAGAGASGSGGGTHKGASGGGGEGSAKAAPAGGGSSSRSKKLEELLENAKEANERAEENQANGK